MTDDRGDDEEAEASEPDEEPESVEDDPTLADLMRGAAISPAAKTHIDKVLRDMTAGLGRATMPKFSPKISGLDNLAALGATMAARQRDTDDFHEKQREQWRQIAVAKDAERQAELDWRAGLLEQQRLTVDALNALNKAQASDRRINVWVLRIAAATLLVSIIAILVTIVLA